MGGGGICTHIASSGGLSTKVASGCFLSYTTEYEKIDGKPPSGRGWHRTSNSGIPGFTSSVLLPPKSLAGLIKLPTQVPAFLACLAEELVDGSVQIF